MGDETDSGVLALERFPYETVVLGCAPPWHMGGGFSLKKLAKLARRLASLVHYWYHSPCIRRILASTVL
jgi:hypothetical protein